VKWKERVRVKPGGEIIVIAHDDDDENDSRPKLFQTEERNSLSITKQNLSFAEETC